MSNKILCLINGEYNGPINITNASNSIIISKVDFKSRLVDHKKGTGLILYNCQNITIKGMIFAKCLNGIWLKNSSNCSIQNNIIRADEGSALVINESSRNNTIMANTIFSDQKNEEPAVVIENSDNNMIIGNDITKPKGYSYLLKNGYGNKLYLSNDCIVLSENDIYIIKALDVNGIAKRSFFLYIDQGMYKELGGKIEDGNNWYC